jgi:hypothetical protein
MRKCFDSLLAGMFVIHIIDNEYVQYDLSVVGFWL